MFQCKPISFFHNNQNFMIVPQKPDTSSDMVEISSNIMCDNQSVGNITLIFSKTYPEFFEMQYHTNPDQRGQGIMPAAILAFLPAIMESEDAPECLFLNIAKRNTASQRVAQKAGFVYDGICWSLTKQQYEEAHSQK